MKNATGSMEFLGASCTRFNVDCPGTTQNCLKETKNKTSLVSKSLEILLSLNQRNQLQTSMAIETSPVQVSSVLQSQGQDLDTQQDLQGLRCHQRPNPQGVGENGKCREMGKKMMFRMIFM